MYKVSTKFVLNTIKPRKDGTFAIKLQVIYKRQKRSYRTGIYCTKEQWQEIQVRSERHKATLQRLDEIKEQVATIIPQIIPFSFGKFKKKYLATHRTYHHHT